MLEEYEEMVNQSIELCDKVLAYMEAISDMQQDLNDEISKFNKELEKILGEKPIKSL